MEYLTVHDFVWINNAITGKVNPYDYFALEACMAAQYCYGDSNNVPTQAAELLSKLLRANPFESGNQRTALISVLSFLNANGYATVQGEAELADAIRAVATGSLSVSEAIASLAAPASAPLATTLALRRLITLECNTHAGALQRLADGD